MTFIGEIVWIKLKFQSFLELFRVFCILYSKSSAFFISLLIARLLDVSFIPKSKFNFLNLLNSGKVIKLIAPRFLFSVSVASVLRAFLVARLIISGILRSASVVFVLKAALVARLVKSGILFSIYPALYWEQQ